MYHGIIMGLKYDLSWDYYYLERFPEIKQKLFELIYATNGAITVKELIISGNRRTEHKFQTFGKPCTLAVIAKRHLKN